jgi:very-short-patch-repair endonuclease
MKHAKFNLPEPSQQMIERSRDLRLKPTDAEQVLWKHLRNRRLGGLKFRRQHPIGNFIADFFVAKRALLSNWMALCIKKKRKPGATLCEITLCRKIT